MTFRLFSLAAVACLLAGPALAIDYPARKPGLWEIQTGEGGAATAKAPGQTIQQCIDAATDKAMREMGQGMGKDMCSRQDLRLEGVKLVIDSVCKIGPTTATSRAVMSGDFSSAYRVESKSTYSPPLMGRTEGTSVVDAKWVGPCKPGQKPGDMVMGNGMKMNMLDAMAKMPARK
ncbi:DUF3617 domain-containing protein [Variovorax boronicumulans]|uniref:DUF3617 domain-containing protein n=1 Tax=Variovorax boronicumulans TaxID=436515 RepID=UPI0012E40A52|nr:DUF3617 family protein [Variovorax boronicumulans]GER20455.1 DUF3617 domain-containing protein [Variovorax boronicumulans]